MSYLIRRIEFKSPRAASLRLELAGAPPGLTHQT